MMTKRLLQICGLLILTGGIAFYLYQRDATPPETITIYKTVKPHPEKENPILRTQTEIASVNDTPAEASPVLNEEHFLNEEGYDEEADSLRTQKASDLTSDEMTDVVRAPLSITEEVLEVPEDPEAWFTEQMDIINASIEEKYPEIYALSTMTQEEIYKKYPTAESRAHLGVLAQDAQSEVFEELRQSFSNVSSDLRAEFLMTLERQLSQNWEDAAVREMVDIIRRDLDL